LKTHIPIRHGVQLPLGNGNGNVQNKSQTQTPHATLQGVGVSQMEWSAFRMRALSLALAHKDGDGCGTPTQERALTHLQGGSGRCMAKEDERTQRAGTLKEILRITKMGNVY